MEIASAATLSADNTPATLFVCVGAKPRNVAGGAAFADCRQGQPASAGRWRRQRSTQPDRAQAGKSRGEAGPAGSRLLLLRSGLRRILAASLATCAGGREPGAGCRQSAG